jgi:type IV secretory pathway VirB2 component (pilin)
MVPSQTATFEHVSIADTAKASSLFSTMRQFASAAGVALISTMLSTRINANVDALDASATPLQQLEAAFTGYDETFLASAAVAVLGIALVFVYRKDSGIIVSPVGDDDSATEPAVRMKGMPEMVH